VCVNQRQNLQFSLRRVRNRMQLCVLIEQLAQARLIVVLSGSTSRPSETLSPKRDCEGRFVFFVGLVA